MFFESLRTRLINIVWIKESHSEYIYVNDMVLVTKWHMYFIMLEDMNPISHQLPRYCTIFGIKIQDFGDDSKSIVCENPTMIGFSWCEKTGEEIKRLIFFLMRLNEFMSESMILICIISYAVYHMPLAITVLAVVRFRHGPYHMDSSLAPNLETSGVPNFKFSSFNFIIT